MNSNTDIILTFTSTSPSPIPITIIKTISKERINTHIKEDMHGIAAPNLQEGYWDDPTLPILT